MKTERLEQVTAWSQLRTLLRVVVRGCRYCGKDHEVTLTHLEERTHHTAVGATDWGVVWIAEPRPACAKMLRAPFAVARLTVEQGRVFRVVDGDEEARSTTRTRKLEEVE